MFDCSSRVFYSRTPRIQHPLGKVLRDKWGFKGMVTSDSGAVADIFEPHHFTPDLKSACVAAISAGCDVESAGWGNDPSKGIGPVQPAKLRPPEH